MGRTRSIAVCSLATLAMLVAPHAAACTACFGDADSAQTQGANYAMITLLGFLLPVAGGSAYGFVAIARRIDESDE